MPRQELVDSRIVSLIYDCAVGAAEWEMALEALINLVDGKCAGIVLHTIAPVRAEVIASINVDQHTQERYIVEYVGKNPVMNCLAAMPLGYATYGSGAVDEKFYFESEFYNSWQKPAGYADNLGVALARSAGSFILLSIPRGFEKGTYSSTDIETLKTYIPHFVRAFNIWLRLNLAETRQNWVSEAIDQIPKGLIILGQQRVILYANKAAEMFLESGGGLSRKDLKLTASALCAIELDELLEPFESGLAEDTVEYKMLLRRAGRPAVIVRAQPPLGRRPGQRNLGLPEASVFLHVIDPELSDRPDIRLFVEFYHLTAGEARFLEALMKTESVLRAAEMMEISEATARSHMRNISAKTETDNFAGLIAAVYRFER